MPAPVARWTRATTSPRLLVLFVIDSFAHGEHVTIRRRRRGAAGPVAEFAITYAVRPDGPAAPASSRPSCSTGPAASSGPCSGTPSRGVTSS
ncbi:MAG TPA: hypothetical protein VGH76_24060 [Actinomycetospora sp.]|uniref:hypothetical protein n=1 Tax=Actinomycetospora sp. TaxID=1872135 RepID=UPI002F42DB12